MESPNVWNGPNTLPSNIQDGGRRQIYLVKSLLHSPGLFDFAEIYHDDGYETQGGKLPAQTPFLPFLPALTSPDRRNSAHHLPEKRFTPLKPPDRRPPCASLPTHTNPLICRVGRLASTHSRIRQRRKLGPENKHESYPSNGANEPIESIEPFHLRDLSSLERI